MSRTVRCLVLVAAVAVLAGCGVKDSVKRFTGLGGPESTEYTGTAYPATQTVAVAFQPAQVDKTCRVFAELLVQFPANATGKDVETAVLTEARARGAHQVLIGQTRQGKEDSGPHFLYYGPAYEYLCADQCGGWKFGFDFWGEQGDWASIGYREWGKAGVIFETPLVIQMVMLRCQ